MPPTVVSHKTRIDVPPGARDRLVPLLNASLADLIDLFNQTKHAHWNVKGPSFIALHELFDEVAERVEEHCDLLAERVVALGGTAHGTTRQSATASRLSEYDLGAVEGRAACPGPVRPDRRCGGHGPARDPGVDGRRRSYDRRPLHRDLAIARQGSVVFLEVHLQGRQER